ncbi:MAG: hypothetical protein WCD42_06315 [Rhizomicrobium sp.]
MNLHSLVFAPLVSPTLIWVIAAAAALFCAYGFYRRARGTWARLLAFAALLLTLSGPSLVREAREPLADIAVIILDRSQSMQIGDRLEQADKALRAIKAKLGNQTDLELRTIGVNSDSNEDRGTEAFAALDAALADIPPSRFAGAIFISDGEIHDAPASPHYRAPLNALIIGAHNEADRKLAIVDAARYGIVGKTAKIVVRVDDLGRTNQGSAQINLRLDGTDFGTRTVRLGQPSTIDIPVRHEGESVVEIEADAGPSELTLQNNRAVATITGVRDRLHVLLVSGEPNAGERVWRALLKGDPSVDLVHFTILRPPGKQLTDPTPASELALIVFPTQQLFADKLSGFDLVIFDRFSNQGILPAAYYANLAEYVEKGGALLVSAGPEMAGEESIYRTPLSLVLPVRPSGRVLSQPFRPGLTSDGTAHPVTRGLPGAGEAGAAPSWGHWFRQTGGEKLSGETLMSGIGGAPLLVLDRVGKGRVAQLMSDQGWLWARGYDGGGPQAELLRRIAHWLMKEPELEEEALSAKISGSDLIIERRSMAKTAPQVRVTDPSGQSETIPLQSAGPGLWRTQRPADALGLYHVRDGKWSAVAAAGPLNPKEVADMRATDAILSPVAAATGGATRWFSDGLPDIQRIDAAGDADGQFALRRNAATRTLSVEETPLLPPWLGLLLLMGTLALAWREEGR